MNLWNRCEKRFRGSDCKYPVCGRCSTIGCKAAMQDVYRGRYAGGIRQGGRNAKAGYAMPSGEWIWNGKIMRWADEQDCM